MSEEEKMVEEMVGAFDDSNIDYEHPIWELADKNGFHNELVDFVGVCITRRSSGGEN